MTGQIKSIHKLRQLTLVGVCKEDEQEKHAL